MLREANLPNMRYHGFVEGDDLGKGAVDVFVTEGFTGNIALKTAEGTARQLVQYMRDAMRYSLMSRIGFLFARKALAALRAKMGPRASGGVFLGTRRRGHQGSWRRQRRELRRSDRIGV